MGKTKRGEKCPGYDFWGRRAMSGNCGYGPEVKKITKHIERARAKRELLDDPESMSTKQAF